MESSTSFAQVVFTNVKNIYSANENLDCAYELMSESTHDEDGAKVGLFKIGFGSVADNVAAVVVTKDKNIVTFAADVLPKDELDMTFYQFCYFNTNGEVKGMSLPFTFTNSEDDICVVNDCEDDLLLIQTKSTVLKQTLDKTVKENNNMIMEKVQMLKDFESLRNKNEKREKEIEHLIETVETHVKEKMFINQTYEDMTIKYVERVKELQEELQATKQELYRLEQLISKMKTEIGTFNVEKVAMMKEFELISAENISLKGSNDDFQKHLREMVVSEASLNLEMMAKNSIVTQLKNDIRSQELEMTESWKTIAKLEERTRYDKRQYESLVQRMTESENMLSAMITSKSMVAKELDAKLEDLNKLQETKDDSLKKYEELKESHFAVTKRCEETQDENLKLNQQLEKSNEINLALKIQLEDATKEKKVLLIKVEDLLGRLDLGAMEYRKKYREWFRAQKKATKLENYIKNSSLSATCVSDVATETGNPSSSELDIRKETTNMINIEDIKHTVVNEERSAKIKAEMENQLQMFHSSSTPSNFQYAHSVTDQSRENALQCNINDDDGHSEYDELQSDSSSDSFFEFNDQTNRETGFVSELPVSMFQLAAAPVVPPHAEPILEMVMCPICGELVTLDNLGVNDHIDSHFFNKCPICFESYGKELGYDLFEKHVNTHIR